MKPGNNGGSQAELKPCPRCGAEAQLAKGMSASTGQKAFWITCLDLLCGLKTDRHDTAEKAVEDWNKLKG